MRKILHIIDTLSVGGAEKLLVGIINGLDGYEHHVILLMSPEKLRPEITVPHHFLNLECRSFNHFFLKINIVKNYIKRYKIDLVHSHLYYANVLARLATPRDIRLINSIHAISSLASYKLNRLTLYVEKLTYKKRHEIIGVSYSVLEDFNKWVGKKGRQEVIYNFIDEKYFNKASGQNTISKPLKLVTVGNLRYQKNHRYLIEAFKKINGLAILDIYGEGHLRSELQAEIDKFNLPIRLCGVRHDLEKILPQYDTFVMSSFYEGQPVALLEATAIGLPAMLSDIPVLREVAGDDAVYFDINDTSSFVEAVQRLVNERVDINSIRAKLFDKINSFAHRDQYINRLKQFYNT